MAPEGSLSLPAVKRLKSSSSSVADCAYANGVAAANTAVKAIALIVEKLIKVILVIIRLDNAYKISYLFPYLPYFY